MKPTVTCGLLIFASVALAQSERAIDFRGLPLGSSETAWLNAMPTSVCGAIGDSHRELGDRRCDIRAKGGLPSEALSYGGTQAESISAYFIGGRLLKVHVAIKPRDASLILRGLIDKFGEPSSVAEPQFKTQGGLSNHPPAEPGALSCEPLKAAMRGR